MLPAGDPLSGLAAAQTELLVLKADQFLLTLGVLLDADRQLYVLSVCRDPYFSYNEIASFPSATFTSISWTP